MGDGLLNNNEIDYVVKQARNSILNTPGFIGKFTKHWLDIFSISPNKKLIFIQGDNDTGLHHINARHRFFTNAHSQVGNNYIKTSRFDMNTGKLEDYIKISEYLYNEKNINIKRNKNPSRLDFYEGVIDFIDNRTYRLFVYKDTKIVHTIFPAESGKKETKFRKENVTIEHQDTDFCRLVIPYVNSNDIVCYGVGIQIFINQKIEKWSLLIYKESILNKVAYLFEQPLVCRFNIEIRFQQINFQNVSNIEKLIYDFDKQENK